MLKVFLNLHALVADRRGVTAIEYAVLAGAVAVALVAVMGTGDTGVMHTLQTKLTSIVNGIPAGTSN